MKVGLIGYGYWGGGFVARNIARVADLSVIVDPNVSRLMEAAAKWTPWGTRVSSEPEVAFRECDAVWIATPARTHYELCMAALEAGCHVMCEKPFVMLDQEAHELCFEAQKRDLTLQVGFTALFTEQHRAVRAVVKNQPEYVTWTVNSRRYTVDPSESDVNVLWGLGPHDIAAVVDLFGPPDLETWSGNDHTVDGYLEFGGHKAFLEFDWLSNERVRQFKLAKPGAPPIEYSQTKESVEPLYLEARNFARLCMTRSDEERAAGRRLACEVTDVLSSAAAMLSVQPGVSV